MRIQKVLLLLLVPVVVEVVIACRQCAETVTRTYSHKSVSVDHLDNSNGLRVSSSSTFSRRSYGIQVNVFGEEVASRSERVSSFFESAYAFDCPPDEIVVMDDLVSIRVITMGKFGTTLAANTDVTDYFKVYQEGRLIGVHSYFATLAKGGLASLKVVLPLLLTSPPEVGGTYQFKVEIALSDGRLLVGETTPIMLLD